MSIEQYHDLTCNGLAAFLKERINLRSTRDYSMTLVKSTRDYEAFNVSLTEYPVLQVFRRTDFFKAETPKLTTSIVAQYCLALPEQENMAALCHYVAKIINRSLNDFKMGVLPITILRTERRAEYLQGVLKANNMVVSALNFNFSIEE